VLEGDGRLVEIAVERPGLHLALVELAAMQEAVEGVQAVIAGFPDMAELGFELVGGFQFRIGGVRAVAHGVHRLISGPWAGMVQPAASRSRRSSDSGRSAGLELLM